MPPVNTSAIVRFYIFGECSHSDDQSSLLHTVSIKTKLWAKNKEKIFWLFPTHLADDAEMKEAKITLDDSIIFKDSSVANSNMLIAYKKASTYAKRNLGWVQNPQDWRNLLWTRVIISLGHFGLFNEAVSFFNFLVAATKNNPSANCDVWKEWMLKIIHANGLELAKILLNKHFWTLQ